MRRFAYAYVVFGATLLDSNGVIGVVILFSGNSERLAWLVAVISGLAIGVGCVLVGRAFFRRANREPSVA